MAMLTTKDVCEQLSISRSSVGRLVALGDLPCYQLGKSLRYYQADIDAYLERCRVKVSPAITCAPVQQPAPPDQKHDAGVLPRHESGVTYADETKKEPCPRQRTRLRCKKVQ